ncbi:VOC family protein [Roseococcus sp. DSY-14]|uniref:VOC family protein n=1 Tax=Roseococcus sp. DSY-14 TaxID=3369650 RepID=UPI00387B65A8
MSAAATTLDHVGICAREAGPLHARFAALGFTLTPLARQSGPGGPLATGNRCAFFRHGYLELLAILDPALPDNGLGALLDRHEGMRILALGMDDAEANLRRLRGAGLPIPGIAPLARPCDDPQGRPARFERLPLPDAPEGRVQLVRHLTPELLWQERWLDHPNRVLALEEAFILSGAPMESAARLSVLAGRPLEPRPAGGVTLRLDHGAVSVLDAAGEFPDLPRPTLGGCAFRTGDGTAAIRALAPHGTALPDGSWLLHEAGAALVFRP